MNNNNDKNKFLIIFSFLLLLITFVLLPLQQYSTATADNTGDLTEQQITTEIARLQKLLTEKQIAATTALTEKDLLATGGNLTTPVIGALQYDSMKNCNPNQTEPAINSTQFYNRWRSYVTDFHCGRIVQNFFNNNTALREFTLIADDNQGYGHYVNITKNPNDAVLFPAWMFNNSLPGPTLRMTQGDHVKITVINSNNSKFAHSFHMHSIHSGVADGMSGPGGTIKPGTNFTYDFIARPFGVYPYHCHMEPVQQHIQRGLYGMMIIDPPTPRPQAKELVMLMNGYSFNKINLTVPNNDPLPMLSPPTALDLRNINETNRDNILNPGGGEAGDDNQFYTVNGMVFGYTQNDMLHLTTNKDYRIYLVNMLEFDPVNSFHMHGNMFNFFPSGTSLTPDYLNDIVTLGQGDRAVLEFKYLVPGDFMIHAHINRFSNLGWIGMLHVTNN